MEFGGFLVEMNKEERTEIKNWYLIFFCIMLVAMPLVFIWHIELNWEINPTRIYTNGWIDVTTIKLYHLHLYSLIIINFLASGYILHGMINKK